MLMTSVHLEEYELILSKIYQMYLTKEELFSKFYFKSSENVQVLYMLLELYKVREEPPLLGLCNSILLGNHDKCFEHILKKDFIT